MMGVLVLAGYGDGDGDGDGGKVQKVGEVYRWQGNQVSDKSPKEPTQALSVWYGILMGTGTPILVDG